ncbi:unnamed protein product [Lactuca virosa]|uniref:Nuclear receptor corepressor 1 n=1 Tax=Lactuca virosa TaxID=75947 RepID=A0AAU9NKV5_9ASTR|nr:unnamed protein product [Lactuca virosa]
MPPEPLPFDRKDFLKDRKPSYADPVGIVPPRWREPPTTPSQHNIHGSSSFCRWGAGGGPSDFRRPFSGLHGKRVGGGWHNTTVESGSKENNCMAFGSLKDPKGVNSWETTASPNGNSLPHNDFVNSLDQLQSADQHAKNSQLGNNTPLGSPSEDASPCVTPMTHDEATSRKKQRLGWGEGLAKYEKKKVDPEDILDKEAGARNGMVDGVSGSEPLLTSPSSLTDKSPSVNGYSECASPTTPYSYACSSSPGLEEKESTKTVTVDNSTCNPASCHVSENDTEGLSSNLENLELNLSSALDKLLQADDLCSPGSKFVKSTAMDKLHVWKAELTKTLEITETEIDSLEHELKCLVSDAGSFPTEYQNKTCGGPLPVEKTDSSPEEVNDSDDKSSDTTSEFVESVSKCSEDVGNDDALGFVTSCGDRSSSTVSDGEDVDNGREDDKLYDFIFATNKVIANETCDELNRILLPTTHLCNKISKSTDESLNKTKIASRKRFLKFKERVITSKFRVLQHAWKEDLQLLSVKKTGAKSQKKFESSSRIGYADHQKYCSSIYSRLYSPGGSVSLVPTTETLDYVKKLLSDSRVKVQRKTLKMPCLILDRSERMMTRFVSDNGLVENPVEVEKERSIVSAWTEEEQGIFLEKYSLFGKDFKKIASFLKNKTCGDCVEFYYKNHKSDCFQKIKKKSAFAKGMSCITNTYLVTSGRRMAADATSLEMLGAASEMVASVDGEHKLHSEMFCNKQETGAGDESCGGEMNPTSSDWTDEEKSSFLQAVRSYGKDFSMISRCMKTRSRDECKVFYSKARKCLGLDSVHSKAGDGDGDDDGDVDHGHGHDDTCMVDSGSVISCDKSSSDVKMEVEDLLHSSDSKQEVPESESEQIVVNEESKQLQDLNSRDSSICMDLSIEQQPVNNNNTNKMELNGVEKSKGCLPGVSSHRKSVSQDDIDTSSRLSFRKSIGGSQRCSSTDGYHHLPKHSLMDCVESSQVVVQKDENLLPERCLPRDSCLQKQSQRQRQRQEVPLRRSYGFWDGNRIQTTGFPSLPDPSSILVSGFGNSSSSSGFQTRQVYSYKNQEPFKGVLVSDPVAAIRMHYAKTEQYNNGSNSGDIGSR